MPLEDAGGPGVFRYGSVSASIVFVNANPGWFPPSITYTRPRRATAPRPWRGVGRSASRRQRPVPGLNSSTSRIVPAGSPVANYGFDVTPARLVTGLITERGVLKASRAALSAAFPERIAMAAE